MRRAPTIHYGAFCRDGTVVVYLSGVRYTYVTDAAYHGRWQRQYRHAPWRVLNEIKAASGPPTVG